MTNLHTLPRPGTIHRLTASHQLADGTWHDDRIDAVILDVTAADSEVTILWEPMDDTGSGYLPQALPSETVWSAGPAGIDWQRSTATTAGPARPQRVGFGEAVGTYKARDETCNSVTVLRDHARAALDRLADWREHPGSLRTEIRRVANLLRSLPDVRDDLIRRGLAAKVPVSKLAQDSGLSEARIYQIRDGRR